MRRYAVLLLLVAMGGTACVAMDTAGTGAPPNAFTHRTANSEVVLLWNCLPPASGVLRVEGVARNPWQSQPIRYLEVQVVGVDAQGRQTAEAAGKARDIQLFTSQQSPFQLDLRTAGTEVRFDLYYQYLFNEEYDAALLAGPPMVGPRRYAQPTRTNMVRDACSATQHLAR
jgi:hypothetical protein